MCEYNMFCHLVWWSSWSVDQGAVKYFGGTVTQQMPPEEPLSFGMVQTVGTQRGFIQVSRIIPSVLTELVKRWAGEFSKLEWIAFDMSEPELTSGEDFCRTIIQGAPNLKALSSHYSISEMGKEFLLILSSRGPLTRTYFYESLFYKSFQLSSSF